MYSSPTYDKLDCSLASCNQKAGANFQDKDVVGDSVVRVLIECVYHILLSSLITDYPYTKQNTYKRTK